MLQLKEFRPDARLKDHIISYYFIENNELSHDTIPPLGFPVVQFHLENDLNKYFVNYLFPLSPVMIVGQLTRFAKIQRTDGITLIGVNLRPTSLLPLTGIRADRFTDTALSAAEIWGEEVNRLYIRLKNENERYNRIRLLDNFFLSLCAKVRLEQDRFGLLVDTILSRKGHIDIDEMYQIFPSSPRTLQRHFLKRIGVNANTYLRIIRNLNLFHALHNNRELSLSDAMVSVGYYDYSHFAREFKQMTGMTPKRYFEGKEAFSHLLTQLGEN